jgi:FO synthase
LRANARPYGALQEVLVQNFRAKRDTTMRHTDHLDLDEYRAAIAVTRILMGPTMRDPGAAQPGGPQRVRGLLAAGVDDWGGVSRLTPDHVNPERPWPSLERLRAITDSCGFELCPRLTAHA